MGFEGCDRFEGFEGLRVCNSREYGFESFEGFYSKYTRIHDTHVYMLYSMHVTYAIHMYTYMYICKHVRARIAILFIYVTLLPQNRPLSVPLTSKMNLQYCIL